MLHHGRAFLTKFFIVGNLRHQIKQKWGISMQLGIFRAGIYSLQSILHEDRTSKLIYSAAPAKEHVQPQESSSLSLQVNQTSRFNQEIQNRKIETNIQYCKALLLGRENWKANYEGESDRTWLAQKQSHQLWSWSLVRGSALWAKAGTETERRKGRGDWLAAEQQKQEIRLWWLFN